MDLIKAQFERIGRHVSDLTALQRTIVALLAALAVGAVIWWGVNSGGPQMTPLLDLSFAGLDLGRIQSHLEQRSIHYVMSGDRILVPADRRLEILADLIYSRKLPPNTQEAFDQISKQMSIFDSNQKQEKIWNHGKEIMLARIIGSFPDVLQADVIIDPRTRERIGEPSIDPTATVNITMREGSKPPPRLADAAADAVCGAQSGLLRKNIKVLVDGHSQLIDDGDGESLASASNRLDLLQRSEEAEAQHVKQSYPYIPGLLVSISMKINVTSTQTEKHEYDNQSLLHTQTQQSSESDESSDTQQRDAALVPNSELAVPSTPLTTSRQTHQKNESQYQNFVPESHTLTKTPAGEPIAVGATIHVPMSYFVGLARQREPQLKDPTWQQIHPLVTEELGTMRQDIANFVGLALEKVAIDTYEDAPRTESPRSAMAVSNPPVTLASLTNHTRQIIVGALISMALLGLGMMIRRSTSPALSPGSKNSRVEPLMSSVGCWEQQTDGMDEQLVRQAGRIVSDNPAAAAAVVSGWLSRS